MKAIKVLIADDLEPISKRYENILKKDKEIEVIGRVTNGYEAVAVVAMHQPDVVLMDVEMETRTAGLDASAQILDKFPETKIIILTVYEDDETVFTAFQLGVTDYFLKNAAPAEIISCVKDAYFGRSPIRPAIAHKIRREFQRVKNSEDSFLYCLRIVTELTQTELDILDLCSQGYSRSQICEIRCVELSTVKTQIHNILRKFNKESMSEVTSLINHLQVLDYIRRSAGK